MKTVRFIKGHPPYNAGEVAGFSESHASFLVEKLRVATFDLDPNGGSDPEVETQGESVQETGPEVEVPDPNPEHADPQPRTRGRSRNRTNL
jgi:hypothetical protein